MLQLVKPGVKLSNMYPHLIPISRYPNIPNIPNLPSGKAVCPFHEYPYACTSFCPYHPSYRSFASHYKTQSHGYYSSAPLTIPSCQDHSVYRAPLPQFHNTLANCEDAYSRQKPPDLDYHKQPEIKVRSVYSLANSSSESSKESELKCDQGTSSKRKRLPSGSTGSSGILSTSSETNTEILQDSEEPVLSSQRTTVFEADNALFSGSAHLDIRSPRKKKERIWRPFTTDVRNEHDENDNNNSEYYVPAITISIPSEVNTGNRNYSCKMCYRIFNRKANLERHMRLHTGERPFQCQYCQSAFTQVANLNYHLRIHNSSFPYSCNMCGKKFRSSSHVTRHIRGHTGEKPYFCPICQEMFSTWDQGKRHLTNVHNSSMKIQRFVKVMERSSWSESTNMPSSTT